MSEQSEEAMLTYYKRLFPYDPYFRWLNYANSKGSISLHISL